MFSVKRLRWTAFLLARALREPADRRLTAASLARLRDRRAREIAHFAAAHVPWYRRAMTSRGISPEDVRTAADLARLPVLDSSLLAERPEDFLPEGASREDWIEIQSSGSSGDPRTIHLDPAGALTILAAGMRERMVMRKHLAGTRRVRSLVLAGEQYPHARMTAALEKLLLRPRRLLPERRTLRGSVAFEELAQTLETFRPHLLHGNGSTIGPFFRRAYEEGIPVPRPRLVTFTSDPLASEERRLIEKEFGIPVLSLYRCTEAVLLGFECGEGAGLHVNDDLFHVRIADDEGRTVPDGESGAVVLSNLVNRGTVILNYRLGDLGAAVPGPCACGRPLPRVELLLGRDYDWVRHPDGRRFHPYGLTSVMDEGGVWRWQLFQDDPGRLVVRAVPMKGVDREALAEKLASHFDAVLGSGMTARVELVDAIPRSAAGKLEVLARE